MNIYTFQYMYNYLVLKLNKLQPNWGVWRCTRRLPRWPAAAAAMSNKRLPHAAPRSP